MTTTSATISANGITVNYRLEGPRDGPVVMLSNSLMSNLAMWDAQVPALTRRYRVLRYDTRGHGATEATPPPYSIELLVDDARALLDALEIAPVHFRWPVPRRHDRPTLRRPPSGPREEPGAV